MNHITSVSTLIGKVQNKTQKSYTLPNLLTVFGRWILGGGEYDELTPVMVKGEEVKYFSSLAERISLYYKIYIAHICRCQKSTDVLVYSSQVI